ncbi:hypothetical protein DY000_02060534 [Brassica cretica]|uniref:Uncharacterized protein n=1 Tax=Brassica cretica TaxID=69181 RepID=A0ABQ7B4P5_BRACR|nr:hypothetical protein DY000_02060534 [Brassica cretica]
MEEGRVVSSVINSQMQSKITEAVDFVFGESAFWNPAAKAKALLFEELKPCIGTKLQFKFLDVGCSKNVRDDLQYLEVWSFHPKEYDSGNGTQRNHHMIDKIQVKRLFFVGPVRHIRQQIEFCFLVVPVILLPHRSSPYLSLPVECSFLRAHQKAPDRRFADTNKEHLWREKQQPLKINDGNKRAHMSATRPTATKQVDDKRGSTGTGPCGNRNSHCRFLFKLGN